MKKSGKNGSVNQFTDDWANEKKYSINDLLYLNSYEKYLQKIFNTFIWLERNKQKEFTAKEIMQKNSVDWKIYKSMKELKFIDEDYNLLIKPNYGSVYALALYHRSKNKNSSKQ